MVVVRSIKSIFSIAVCVLLLLASLQVSAQPLALAKFVAGTHYQVLENPIKLAPEDKIEVMEVFWYGCGHCYTFEPFVQAWKKTIAEDVAFMRTPAVWSKPMDQHGALYYVTQALDLPNEIHNDIFALLTKERRLDDENKFAEVFSAYGVDKETFLKAYNSFGIKSKVKQAKTRAQKHYLTQGTPELVVNGKYRVNTSMGGGHEGMLEVVDFLIDLERG